LWLKAAELQIAQKDAAGALATFAKVLQAEPDNLRALYGSGVAYALQGNAEKAKEVFTRLVVVPAGQSGAGPIAKSDPYIRAWSHVYLGRLHDVEGNRELALSDYRAALAVEGAPETARIAARSGLEKRFGAAAVKPGQETPRP
jgi:tetratricopeptide (TPR) repeat protein